ncbi:MAG TPA: class I SAM-dependent methyltransferase [Gemmatimonadales bacterium]|nr:class I SAM-dependent methyltransferase [Gemmatimonadales bacterium]
MSDFSHVYDAGFFDYIVEGARRSARATIGLAHEMLQPTSVLDVGCGRGIWLAEWVGKGVSDVYGIDGSYLDATTLEIAPGRFMPQDLSQPFWVGRRFDLIESLEVAEHLPESAAESFIDSLTRHGDVIMFSAAVPGQGGEYHVNEQPLEYWREKFARRGYAAYDPLRRVLRNNDQVEPWYRYNLLVYASPVGEARLTKEARSTRLAEGTRIPDIAPISWRLRNLILRQLPRPAIEGLARVKHRVIRATRN